MAEHLNYYCFNYPHIDLDFIFNICRPKESPPSMKDMPNVRLVDNGKKLVCDMRINSKSRPTTMWYFGNSLLKLGGRYRMDVKEESPGVFLIFLEIANVSFHLF